MLRQMRQFKEEIGIEHALIDELFFKCLFYIEAPEESSRLLLSRTSSQRESMHFVIVVIYL